MTREAKLQDILKTQNQSNSYAKAFKELQIGHKDNHWIWYIFPQLKGQGSSDHSLRYDIMDFEEACDYLLHPVLFQRYFDIVQLVEEQLLKKIPVETLMGSSIDALKLRSSLTLFREAADYLAQQQKGSYEQYALLSQRCDRIFELIKPKYTPCEFTLSHITKPKVKSATPEIPKPSAPSIEALPSQQAQLNPLKSSKASSSPQFFTPPTSEPLHSTVMKLDLYIAERTREWYFHYNFLCIMSLVYFMKDYFSGSHYSQSKSRAVKIEAATKLRNMLDPDVASFSEFTQEEKEALQEGRLGKITEEEGGLDFIIQRNSLGI